jgi:hypothetical protein
MRLALLACSLGALALTALAYPSDPAAAAKTKMGCERGKEVWNASAGKCMPGKAKMAASKAAKKKTAAKAAPKAVKSAPAAKSAPAETKK